MRPALLVVGMVLVGALLVLWFFATHERVVTEMPAAYEGEARFNDFLAAEMLLRELEIEADSRASLTPSEWLPETSDTLFVPVSATFAAAAELDILQTWVLNGGHLVLLAAEQSTEATDDVLEIFGLRQTEIEFPAEAYVGERVLTPRRNAKPGSLRYVVDRAGVAHSLEVTDGSFGSATLLDEYGVAAARRAWGAGFLTVIAGSSLFENPSLARSDHARLLLDVVAGYLDSGKVWFVYDARFPSLWQLIWARFPYVVAGIALTIFLWLWAVMPRFGPTIAPVVPARRSIVEHVEAAGRFVWRHHGAVTLIASSTGAVLRRAESRHPGIARLTLAERAQLIAKMTRQPAETVLAAFESRGPMGHREFTHRIQSLQKIRNRL